MQGAAAPAEPPAPHPALLTRPQAMWTCCCCQCLRDTAAGLQACSNSSSNSSLGNCHLVSKVTYKPSHASRLDGSCPCIALHVPLQAEWHQVLLVHVLLCCAGRKLQESCVLARRAPTCQVVQLVLVDAQGGQLSPQHVECGLEVLRL